MNYINDEVKIDFPVSGNLKYLMDECEKYDKEDDYGMYSNMAIFLTDNVAKEAYVTGALTKKQWETIERRYPQ